MENLNINNILDRTEISNQIKNILSNFETTKHDLSIKKGIYLYGNPGVKLSRRFAFSLASR